MQQKNTIPYASSFDLNADLDQALVLMRDTPGIPQDLPRELPYTGIGETAALEKLAPHVLGNATHLNSAVALAHMDPPTPWITWATALWNASLNQNLLHEATSPFASRAEDRVLQWLKPFFGMSGGHFCAGSSLANLTALWAARDIQAITKVVASDAAHLSVAKAARILGLDFETVPVDEAQRLDPSRLGDLSKSCLVLTAGTTAAGAIDPLQLAGRAAWTHVDAAWAGPLCLGTHYKSLLQDIEGADSVAVSAHKWLFQPKDSAIIFFRDADKANEAISFGGGYLASPNVGVQGSRSAAAIPLLATLLAFGQEGIAALIEQTMSMAEQFAKKLDGDDEFELWSRPTTAISIFRPVNVTVQQLMAGIPDGMLSTCTLNDELWVRSVAANPAADIDRIYDILARAVRSAA